MGKRKKHFQEVTIIDLAHKGQAIGKKKDGEIILVDNVVPGDVVDVITTRKKKGMWMSKPTNWHSYSKDRITPFCDHFGECGGCKWQNLHYDKQLEFKEKSVGDALRRIGSFQDPKIHPILASPVSTNYRNKMEFSFSSKRWISEQEINSGQEIKNRNALGLHPPSFFDRVVDLNTCHLQGGLSNEIRNFVRSYTEENNFEYYDSKGHEGFLRSLTIRQGTFSGSLMINISYHYEDDRISKLNDAILERFEAIDSLNYCINPKFNDSTFDLEFIIYYGPGFIAENINHCTYQIGPKSFFQTNSYQAKNMFEKIKEFANKKPYQTIYDLYCGTGSIGLYLADAETTLVGIEQVEEAIIQARTNQEINNIKNAHFYTGDVNLVLDPELTNRHGSPDLIVVDPPRAGLHKGVVEILLKLNCPRIIYVSCNPSTQARDLSLLAANYEVLEHQPLDMFPHTHHTENISLLKLK